MRKNKFNNKKVVIDGIKFDSCREAGYYQQLKIRESKKEISELELQPVFELQPSFFHRGKTIRAIKYIADFRYFDNIKNKVVVVDVKGAKTQYYLLKKKMFLYKIAYCEFVEI